MNDFKTRRNQGAGCLGRLSGQTKPLPFAEFDSVIRFCPNAVTAQHAWRMRFLISFSDRVRRETNRQFAYD